MDFPQTTIPFKSNYNAVFRRKLRSVPLSEANPKPAPYDLCETLLKAGPVPQLMPWSHVLLAVGVFGGVSLFIAVIALLVAPKEFQILVVAMLCFILLFHAYRVHDSRRLDRRTAKAYANKWIVFYPALIGPLYLAETKKGDGDTPSTYFYETEVLVVAPNGDTQTISKVRMKLRGPSSLVSADVSLTHNRAEASLDSIYNNGWGLFAVVSGAPLETGTFDHGLSKEQVSAGLERVQHGWPMDKLGRFPYRA
ncbi:hypothetical protein ACKFRM_08860 [Corynebacterium sp. YSMAA1_1_D6]|uniref:hypothetical protein n=1 Tax=Corynebacterium sp. YSMAA1_1_D6 TaxID=3383589 RepID=UPI0038D0612C